MSRKRFGGKDATLPETRSRRLYEAPARGATPRNNRTKHTFTMVADCQLKCTVDHRVQEQQRDGDWTTGCFMEGTRLSRRHERNRFGLFRRSYAIQSSRRDGCDDVKPKPPTYPLAKSTLLRENKNASASFSQELRALVPRALVQLRAFRCSPRTPTACPHARRSVRRRAMEAHPGRIRVSWALPNRIAEAPQRKDGTRRTHRSLRPRPRTMMHE